MWLPFSSLFFESHVEHDCKKVSLKIGALRRSFRQLSPDARRLYFLSVIQPDLEYAACVTVPTMTNHLRDRLLAVWRKSVRCIAGVKWHDEVPPLLDKLRLTHLKHRWLLQTAINIRRCHMGCAPEPLCCKLKRTVHPYATRGNNHSYRPFVSSTLYGSMSFSN